MRKYLSLCAAGTRVKLTAGFGPFAVKESGWIVVGPSVSTAQYLADLKPTALMPNPRRDPYLTIRQERDVRADRALCVPVDGRIEAA